MALKYLKKSLDVLREYLFDDQLKYLEKFLSDSRAYLIEHSNDRPRIDGYLIGLVNSANSIRRFFGKKKKAEVFVEGVEGLVNEFSSMERLEALCS